jgi:hypothetical protein
MFRDWQENTHSIFCDGPQDPRQRMDVWFCVTQEPRREAQLRPDELLRYKNRRSPERERKSLPHLTKTYHGSRHIGHL